MAQEERINADSVELRQQAEEMLLKKNRGLENLPPGEAHKLLHELQVHQIELEMQNEELRRVQRELEWSREKYFNLYDLAPVGYVSLDEKGLILEANLTAARLLGSERRYLIRRPLSRFIHRDDQDLYYICNKQLSETRCQQVCEMRMLRKDSAPLWVRIDISVAHGSDDAAASRAIIIDITERKNMEEALRSRERQYRDLFENMIDGFTYCRMIFENGRPQDFIYLSVNHAFEKLTGLQNVVGKKATEVIPGIREADPTLFEIYGSVSLTGKTERFETFVAALKEWFTISVYSPEKEFFVTVFDVITKRKQAEEALKRVQAELEDRVHERTAQLREQAKILESFFQHTQTGLVFLDKDFNFLQVNEAYARACGRKTADFIGHNHFVDYPSEELREKFRQVLTTKEPYQAYAQPYGSPSHPELGVMHWNLAVAPILGDDGEVELMILSLLDVTERVRLQEEAVRAAKLSALGELSASIAHEVNNPINSIINYAQILIDKGDRNRKEYAFTGEILQEGKRVADIVRNLLSFARDEKAAKSYIEPGDVITSSLSLTNAVLREEGIHLQVEIAPNLPPIRGNLQQLQQVVLNLISNARHALNEKYSRSDPGKVLEIRCEEAASEDGSRVRITVRDSGIGIPESLIGRVTEPFFTTKSGEVGTGLGLSISRKIVDDHQGMMTVDSAKGQYARFVIDLPAAKRYTLRTR